MFEHSVSDKKSYSTAILLISVVTIITFFPLLTVGFTTLDDMISALRTENHRVFAEAIEIAKHQGRFHMIFHIALTSVPYLVKNLLYFKVVSIGIIILNIFAFCYLIHAFAKSAYFSLLVAVIYLVSLQNMWEHCLLTSYPFLFQAGILFLMASILFFKKYLDSSRYWYLIASALLYSLSLMVYEVFVLYFVLFVFLSLYHARKTTSNAGKYFRKSLYATVPHFSVLIIYLSIYFIFRHLYPSEYEGVVISHFSFKSFLKVMYQYSVSSLPTYIYHHYDSFLNAYSYAFDGHRGGLMHIIENARVEWLAKALVSSFLVYSILRTGFRIFTIGSFLATLLLSTTLFLIPVILPALTIKYQSWVANWGSLAFTVTFFSYFGTILTIAAILTYINQIIIDKTVASKGYALLVGLMIASVSLITDYSNFHVTTSQAQSQLKWITVDEFLKTKDFLSIPENSIVYAPSLLNSINIAATPEPYWTRYIKARTGKNLTLLQNTEDLPKLRNQDFIGGNIYSMRYSQENKSPDQFIVFSKIGKIDYDWSGTLSIYSNKVTLYTYSKYRKFLIYSRMEQSKSRRKVFIDGSPLRLAGNDSFYYLIDKEKEKKSFITTSITSSKADIDVDSVLVSYFTDYDAKNVDYVKQIWQKDFYDLEGAKEENWRWCGRRGQMILRNVSDNDLSMEIKMILATNDQTPSKLRIEGGKFHDELLVNAKGLYYNRKIALGKKSDYAITFSSDGQRVEAPGDPRYLVFKVINFEVEY